MQYKYFNPCNVRPSTRRHGLRIACGCVPRRERSLRRSSSPKKVTPRLCCSLVNALTTRRLATNFFRFQAVGCCALSLVGNAHRAFRGEKHGRMPCGRATGKHYIIEKIHNKSFQPMQCPSVERTFCNLLYVCGRGRRSSSRTAHRLRLRSSPRTLSPSFLLSEKSHAASLLLACKRAHDAPTCYQLFSVSGGRVLCIVLSACRERTLGVPRKKTWADAVRSGDGET